MSVCLLAVALVVVPVAMAGGCIGRYARYRRLPPWRRVYRWSFAPLTALLRLATGRFPGTPLLDAGCLDGMSVIRERWAHIRDEAIALRLAGGFDAATKRRSVGHYDAAFRTFAPADWTNFRLKWHGAPYRSARRLCPETVRILERVPGVRAAMFSILPAGAEQRLPADPVACSWRYHLGLETPGSDRCFIRVAGTRRSWRNGEDFVVDGAYPQYLRNATGQTRLVLLCEVDRPMNPLGRVCAGLHSAMARAMAVPNAPEDAGGFPGRLFTSAACRRGAAGAGSRRAPFLRKLAAVTVLTTLAVLIVVMAFDWVAGTVAATARPGAAAGYAVAGPSGMHHYRQSHEQ